MATKWGTGQKELDHPFQFHFDLSKLFQGATSAHVQVLVAVYSPNLWLRGLDHLKDRREKDNLFRDETLPEDTQNFMDWEKNKCQCP